MSKDLLHEATRALREVEDVSELEARATRARIMSGLHQTRVKRRTRYAFLLPLAATFVAASAWGAASGNAQLVWQRIEQVVTRTSTPSSKSVGVVGKKLSPVSTPDTAPAPSALPVSDAPALGDPSPASASAPAASAALPVSSGKSLVTDAHSLTPQTSEERVDPTLALYRVAHAAHFVDHDPTRALAAWDAYLAAAPNGTFAPEARYNRALSLVRLGRNAEAKTALAPFAHGVYGSYRQSEARALVEQLELIGSPAPAPLE